MRDRSLSRRAVMIAATTAAVTLLAACTGRGSDPRGAVATPDAAASVPPAPPASVTPRPSPTLSPASPTPAPGPDLAAIAARYRGQAPTAWGMDLPGIRSTLAAPTDPDGSPRVALTFDACGGRGGSGVDRGLIDGLRQEQIPATLFLNARWIEANPDVARELASDPLFVLGNHGTRHVPLSVTGQAAYGITGTASADEAVAEVWGNHLTLTELTGSAPRLFRAGTAHYDDVAVRIVADLGETPIGFTVNGDGGATYGAATVSRELATATAGGIVLAHMNHPDSGTHVGAVRAAVDLRSRGVRLVHVEV